MVVKERIICSAISDTLDSGLIIAPSIYQARNSLGMGEALFPQTRITDSVVLIVLL
jgi:hypothetical protein